jgi:hypothetical protein
MHPDWSPKNSIPGELFLRRALFECEKGTCLHILHPNSLISMLTSRNFHFINSEEIVLPPTPPPTPANNGHPTFVDPRTTTLDSLPELEVLSPPTIWVNPSFQLNSPVPNTPSEGEKEWTYGCLRELLLNKITGDALEMSNFLETRPGEEVEDGSESEYYDVCEDESESEYYDVHEGGDEGDELEDGCYHEDEFED